MNYTAVFLPDSQYYDVEHTNPEKVLLLAMLDRALLDLKPNANHLDRRTALTWFTCKCKNAPDTKFTYAQVIEYLDLTDIQIHFIEMQVADAKREEEIRIKEAMRLGVNTIHYRRPETMIPTKKKRSFRIAGRSFKVDMSRGMQAHA